MRQGTIASNHSPTAIHFFSFFLFILAIVLLQPKMVLATSCSVGGGTYIIGEERIADRCVPEGMNDDTAIHFVGNTIICQNGQVVTVPGYTIQGYYKPKSIVSTMKSYPFKVFRNKEGTHIIGVHRYYFGTIDGKSMGSYSTGSVTTDLFDEALALSWDAPDCRGKDYNTCPLETASGSTVNKGTGRYSHHQELFATRSRQLLAGRVDLFYRSFPEAPSAIGGGWSHSYDMRLEPGAGSSQVFWQNGKRRVYESYNSGYVSPKDDYSTLVQNEDSTFTLTEKNGIVRQFDATGLIMSMTDRNGNVMTFSYSDDLLASVTDANGRSISFSYVADDTLSAITDPNGNSYQFHYTNGQLSRVVYPDTAEWVYTYTANGLLLSKTDPEGHLTTYTYDSADRLTTAVDPRGRVRSYSHAVLGSVGKVPDLYPIGKRNPKNFSAVEKDGGEWSYTFDTLVEAVTSKTDPLGHTTTYSYDNEGRLTSKTEPEIGTTSYSYDDAGNIISVTDPLGQQTSYTYNAFGQVLTVSGAPGSYSYSYDGGGNLLSMTNPAGETVQYAYDSRGNLTGMTDADGNVLTLAYDTANNLLSVTQPSGAVTAMSYDAAGNVLTVTNALGHVTTMTYDSRNRLATTTDPAGNITTATYDGNSNPASVSDANGNVTAYTYNEQGQMTELNNALNQLTTLSYGSSGCPSCSGVDKLNSLTDAKSQQTSFSYDQIGRLMAESDPLGKTTSFSYGATKQPTARTAAGGNTVNYTYDVLQRLTQKAYPNGETVDYSYDSRGNILTADNAAVDYTMTYDAGNRVSSVADNRGYSLGYEYDATGRRSAMTFAPGTSDEFTITYSYDADHRLTGMTTPAGSFSFAYDLLGRRTALTYPHGVVGSYSYDETHQLNWLTGISYTSGSGELLSVAYPLHDNVGNRLQRNEDGDSVDYSYDAVYQVTAAQSSLDDEGFSYDAVGNRTAGPSATDSYTHNAANQMIQGGELSFAYDERGNQSYRYLNSAQTDYWHYSWNAENQLIQAELTEAGTTVRTLTFEYDAFGRRVEKQITENGTTKTSSYVYDGEDILLRIDNDGSATTTTYIIHGPGIDEPLAMIHSGQTYYYHADGLGSIVAITDSSQTIVQHYDYETFGQLTASDDFTSSYAFTGREWDEDLSLYYYRARYYDAQTGRFISKDPIGFAGGDVNVYRYVGNNSANEIDPLGLKTYLCKKPLSFGGTGIKSGPDIPGNPLYHQWSCVVTRSGSIVCGGQDRSGKVTGSPGKPSNDTFSSKYCEESLPDYDCFEKCLQNEWSKPRPYYGIPFGTDCQEYDDRINLYCRQSCGVD
ncbi:RHS repeat-associated core domain-containing protein [Pelobacter seleniigenes]|uniref:RHS repeat-associated core domain-containing protein n=1 Tax=Pelobacter seleniigenes TaxID=407188 RepID=UPI0004A6EFFF|nr:RHS repeat-associated core domain-containing protein [Pelobacter seleniigenes]